VRVSLYDLEGGDAQPFVDLIEEADALVFGSPTINGDAVKPVWDLLSSLTMVDVKGKLGAAFRLLRLERRSGADDRRPPASPEAARAAAGRQGASDADRRRLFRLPRPRPPIALHLLGRATPRTLDMANLA
jgi:hypothetical protein